MNGYKWSNRSARVVTVMPAMQCQPRLRLHHPLQSPMLSARFSTLHVQPSLPNIYNHLIAEQSSIIMRSMHPVLEVSRPSAQGNSLAGHRVAQHSSSFA